MIAKGRAGFEWCWTKSCVFTSWCSAKCRILAGACAPVVIKRSGWIGLALMFGTVWWTSSLFQYSKDLKVLPLATPWILGCVTGAIGTLFLLYTAVLFSEKPALRAKIAIFVLGIVIIVAVVGLVLIGYHIMTLFPPYQSLVKIFGLITTGLLVLSAIIFIADIFIFWDSRRRGEILAFDAWIFCSVLITHNVDWISAELFNKYVLTPDFTVSFQSGAVTFEIMLACLLFDPTEAIIHRQDPKEKAQAPHNEASATG